MMDGYYTKDMCGELKAMKRKLDLYVFDGMLEPQDLGHVLRWKLLVDVKQCTT